MEAALCLGYGPSPSISLRMMPSSVPASTKLQYFGFNHSPLSVAGGFASHRRRCHHFYSTTAPLAIDRSNINSMPNSEKDKDGGSKVVGAAAVGASLALACALSIIGCSCSKMTLKAIAGPKQQIYRKAPSFEKFVPVPPRKMALQSLLDVTEKLASKDGRSRTDVSPRPPSSPPSPSKGQTPVDQLKKEAVILMKRGQPENAVFMLKHEQKKYELSDPESAYSMNMLLVEILICQGKYEEAFDFMSTHDQKISDFDVRPTLYKAIICTMLEREEEAQKLWEEFANSIGGFSPYGPIPY